jgi:hypothetical protein
MMIRLNDKNRKAMFAKGKPKRKMTQKELQNIQVKVTDAQMQNMENMKKDKAKAVAKGDNRPIWEIRAEQVNFNHKQVELWDKMNDADKTKLLKANGIEDKNIAKNLKKSFMDLGKQEEYGNTDFRGYLSPEINSHFKQPTEWFDKQ